MTRPYSQDLRERAVSLVSGRQSRCAVDGVGSFHGDPLDAATGSCVAKPMGGSRRAMPLPERDWLLARIAAAPDFTLGTAR